MANTKLPSRLLDTSAIPALNVTGDLTVDTTTLKVDSTNNRVGIGIASPLAKLHIVDGNNNAQIGDLNGSSTMALQLADSGASPIQLEAHGTSLRINTSTTSGATPTVKMIVLANGNVGIGVTDPDTKLEVKGTSAAPSATAQILSVTNTTGGTRLDLGVAENSYGWIQAREGGTLRNLLLNSAGGNVGIGTSNPSALLEVASGAPTITLNASGQATNKKKVRLAASQYTAGDFNIQQMNDDGTTIALAALTVINGGRVGIGKTSPTGSLHVNTKDNSGADVHVVVQNTTANRIAGYKVQDESGNTGINLLYDNGSNAATLESPIGGLTLSVAGITTLTSGAANLGTLQLSSQAATYQLTGGNNIGYLGYKTGGYHRWFGSDGVEEMRLSADQLLIPGHATNGTSPIKIGSATITEYVDLVLQTNTGTAEFFKAGTGYTGWGGASALNIYNSSGNIAFHPSGTQNAVQMTSAGIVMGAGKGIDFSADANASGMSSEILDDYEEGTWTPTLGSETVAGSGSSTNYNNKYVKIGRLVHVTGWFNAFPFSSITSGNYVMVRGLPFRPEHHSTSFKFSYTTATLQGGNYGYGHTSLYACYILVGGSTGAAVHLTRAAIGAPSSATTHFMFDATYYTND
jgi:hypothetical protein